jgi:hypothetical protein
MLVREWVKCPIFTKSRDAGLAGSDVADQPMAGGEQARQGPAGHSDLGVDVFDVMAGGSSRDHQLLGNFGVLEPEGHQLQHFYLTWCQPGW